MSWIFPLYFQLPLPALKKPVFSKWGLSPIQEGLFCCTKISTRFSIFHKGLWFFLSLIDDPPCDFLNKIKAFEEVLQNRMYEKMPSCT
jgi:hypothetical protein